MLRLLLILLIRKEVMMILLPHTKPSVLHIWSLWNALILLSLKVALVLLRMQSRTGGGTKEIRKSCKRNWHPARIPKAIQLRPMFSALQAFQRNDEVNSQKNTNYLFWHMNGIICLLLVQILISKFQAALRISFLYFFYCC